MVSKYFVPIMLFMLVGYAAIGAIPAVKALPTCKITSISTPSIAEPSTGSPGDKDGFPDGSKIGSADPSDFQIVVNCTVDTAISGVEVELINTDHDPFGDESPIVTDFEIDDDNPRTVGSLDPGNYYFFWSLNKDQTVAMKNNAEQYQVNLSWTSPSPGFTLSELFNIICDGSASIAQSDLDTVQTYPTIFTNLEMVPGERFTVCILWEQSSSSLDDLVASIYYNGSILRLVNFTMYYYNIGGTIIEPPDISTGCDPSPPTPDAIFMNDTYLNLTQLSALSLSTSDHWLGCWTFETRGPGEDSLYMYSQTRAAATGNWKISLEGGPINITVLPTKITVIKDAIPIDPQDFRFEGNITDPFYLDDDGNNANALMNYSTFEVDPGVYNITEILPSGWELTDIIIQEDSPSNSSYSIYGRNATLVLDVGEWINITFVNTKQGKITVIKDTDPDADQNFNFTSTGGLWVGNLTLDDNGNNADTFMNYSTYGDLTPGTYNVTELVPAGWDLVAITIDEVTANSVSYLALNKTKLIVDPGEWINVTFTNVEIPEEQGLITVIKNAVPDDDQDFNFELVNITDIAAPYYQSFYLDNDGGSDPTYPNLRNFIVDAGTYNVSEIVPYAWILNDIIITDPTGDSTKYVSAANATLVVAPGETVTVEFVDWRMGKITLIKDAIPEFGDTIFPLRVSNSTYAFTFNAQNSVKAMTFTWFTPGTYNVTETIPSGWNLTNIIIEDDTLDSSFVLADGNATIVIGPGEWINVTFVNIKRPRITICKDATPYDGTEFEFELNNITDVFSGPFSELFTLIDGVCETYEVDPGTYVVNETVPGGWDLVDIIIDENSPLNSSINLAAHRATLVADPGEWINVTFVDEKLGRITVIKDVLPDTDEQDFNFTSDLEAFTLDDDGGADGTYLNEKTFFDITPGLYNITEIVPGDWVLSNIIIEEDSLTNSTVYLIDQTAEIKVDTGEWVNVTFVNDPKVLIIVVKDTIPDGPQIFSYIGTGIIGGFNLKDDGTSSNSKSFLVAPGQYNITELNSEMLLSIGIQESVSLNSYFILVDGKAIVNAEPGETVQVTFTNEGKVPVGGYFVSVNKFSMISPYLAMIVIFGAVSALLMMAKKRKK